MYLYITIYIYYSIILRTPSQRSIIRRVLSRDCKKKQKQKIHTKKTYEISFEKDM